MQSMLDEFLETRILSDVIRIPEQLYFATFEIVKRVTKLNNTVVYHLEDSQRGRYLSRMDPKLFAELYLVAILDIQRMGKPFVKFVIKTRNAEDDYYSHLLAHNLVAYLLTKSATTQTAEKGKGAFIRKRIVYMCPEGRTEVSTKKYNKVRVYADRMILHRRPLEQLVENINTVYPGMYPEKVCYQRYKKALSNL